MRCQKRGLKEPWKREKKEKQIRVGFPRVTAERGALVPGRVTEKKQQQRKPINTKKTTKEPYHTPKKENHTSKKLKITPRPHSKMKVSQQKLKTPVQGLTFYSQTRVHVSSLVKNLLSLLINDGYCPPCCYPFQFSCVLFISLPFGVIFFVSILSSLIHIQWMDFNAE